MLKKLTILLAFIMMLSTSISTMAYVYPIETIANTYLGTSTGLQSYYNMQYDKLEPLIAKYTAKFTLEAIDGASTLENTKIRFNDGTQQITEFELSITNKYKVIELEVDETKGTASIDSINYLSAQVIMCPANMKVHFVIERQYLGYQFISSAYVNKYDGGTTYGKVEFEASDTDLYEYYMGYSLALPTGWLEIKQTINGVETYKRKFNTGSGHFGLMKIDSLNSGSNSIKLEVNMDASWYGAGGVRLYKKKVPMYGKITTPHNNIGDNTLIELGIKGFGVGGYNLQIYDVGSNNVLYNTDILSAPDKVYIVPGMSEGNILVGVRIVDGSNNLESMGNTLIINKLNVLSRIIGELDMNRSEIIVVKDKDRFFEDNENNRELVKKIKEKGNGIYFIYDNPSDVLEPLLK